MSDAATPPEGAQRVGAAQPGTFRAIARVLPFARDALPRIGFGILAAAGASLVALCIPQVMRWIVDGPLSTPGARVEDLTWPFLLVLVLAVAEACFVWLRRTFVLTPGTHIEAGLRNALYRRLQRLPVAFHDRWPGGQLLSRVTADTNLTRRWLSFGFVFLIVNALTVIVGLVFLFLTSWPLAIVFLVASVPLSFATFHFEGRYRLLSRQSQDQSGDLATAVEESVHGIRVLKAFGRGRHSLEQFSAQACSLQATEVAKARADAGFWLWLYIVPDVTFAIALLLGVWLVSQGGMTVGDLIAFFATATVLRFPVESLGALMAMTFDTRTATDRLFEILDAPNPITSPAAPARVERAAGRLEFEGVRFRYEDAKPGTPDLLQGVDLAIEPGETVALVGVTGSGKTTLTALAGRFYDVTGGRILVDGVDIRGLSLEDLRHRVGMAFEDATLFSDTVRANVLLGRPDLADDEAESERVLVEALEVAQAAFAYALPEGVDTVVGEEGLSLSGGQRQRLALARAVAARAEVLVLDDPLSALDVDTEAQVEAALGRVLGLGAGNETSDGRRTTALIVAHRPSTVQLADRVALVKDGRIAAFGPHSELLATSADYRYVISSLQAAEADEVDS